MNWKLILQLSLFGLALGIVSVLGLTRGHDWLPWLAVGLISAWVIAKKAKDDFFLHGFFVGIVDGTFGALVQALLFSTYLANNPRMVESLRNMPEGIHPAIIVLIFGPLVGALSGVIFGLLAAVASKFVRRQEPLHPTP